MLAMVVNDNAGHLAHRSVLRSIASNRASTGCSCKGPALDDIFALKHRTAGAGLLAMTAVNPPPSLLARHIVPAGSAIVPKPLPCSDFLGDGYFTTFKTPSGQPQNSLLVSANHILVVQG